MGCSTSKSTEVAERKEHDGDVLATAAGEPPKASDQPRAKQPGTKHTVVTPPSRPDQPSGPEGPDGPSGPRDGPTEVRANAGSSAAPAAAGSRAARASGADAQEQKALPRETTIIFVLGGPGSGKGTQCEKIVEKYGFHHLSAGDLLRAEVKSGSELGQELQGIMSEGRLVPTEVTVRLLRQAMVASPSSTFLIDGFPRALDQAEVFERELLPCALVLFFDLDEDTMRSRLLKRGETSGRADDNEATITKRFHTFTAESLPVIEHYERQGRVARISAAASPGAIFERVQEALDSLPTGKGAQAVQGQQAPADEQEALAAA